MFYPPSLLDLSSGRPQLRPVHDIPAVIVRHRPVLAFVARLAAHRGAAAPRTASSCPEPRPETS